jgi:hypothetical protein
LYFRAPRSQCDCGTKLKSQQREASKEEPLEERVARLKAKGFGEAKIARLVEQEDRQKNKVLRARENRGKGSDPSASVQEWLRLLNEMIRNHGVRTFGILFHEYSGNQTLEDFEIEGKVNMKLGNITEEDLRGLKPDIAYEIVLS